MEAETRTMLEEFTDPLFMDINKLDFRLQDNSPLRDLDFKEVTLDGIGIREDYPDWLKPAKE
jgi:hypothetical protein